MRNEDIEDFEGIAKMSRKMILQVPCIDQTSAWPTGCESVSAVMLLQYLGFNISVDEFIKEYLPCRQFESRDGKLIGADPALEFAGNPYTPDSMGCYAPVIKDALQRVISDRTGVSGTRRTTKQSFSQEETSETAAADVPGTSRTTKLTFSQEETAAAETPEKTVWQVEDLTGVPMDQLCTQYLDHGWPVVFWACIDMKEPVNGPDWYLEDGKTLFSWVSNEHCMLLVGYDETNYYFNDPWNHHGTIGYPKALTEARHKAQYEMAVTVVQHK